MKQFLSGLALSVILCGLYATAQQPHVTQTLPSSTVKLNGASGGGGDITDVDIATTSPLTGGANCSGPTCSFTLGLTGGVLSGLTSTRIPVATAADAIGNSVITHNSTTGVTSIAGTGPSLTLTDDNLTTTSTDALVLQNTTAATSGVTVQYSPRLRFVGSAWKSNATAAAQSTEWWIENAPTSRPATPSNALVFQPRLNGGALGSGLSMCVGDVFAGLLVGGTLDACHTGAGFKGFGQAGANIIGAWANGTLAVNVGSNHLGMAAGTTLFWNSTTLGTGGTSTGDTNLIRQAAGVVGVRGASSIRGAILGARVVAAQASTPLTLVDPTDIDKVYTNEGATASIVFNLPTAVAGLTYTFVVQDADGLSVVAAAGDTIRMDASVSAAAGNIASTTIGNTVTLVAINATEWVAIFYVGTVAGTWTVT